MHYEQVDRGMSKSAEGATEYLLSRGNQHNPYPLSVSDREGSEADGSASDFEAPSVSARCDF